MQKTIQDDCTKHNDGSLTKATVNVVFFFMYLITYKESIDQTGRLGLMDTHKNRSLHSLASVCFAPVLFQFPPQNIINTTEFKNTALCSCSLLGCLT